MLCFIRLKAATLASKTQEKNNKEIRHRGAYLLSPLLFVCNLGKKKQNKTKNHPELSLYLLYQLFPLPTSSRGWPWETCH